MKTKKSFRLFKRADDGSELPPTAVGYKERHYYFRFTYRGKAYPRCLETNDATEAQRRAKAKFAEITDAVQRGEFQRLAATKIRQEAGATFTELFAAYRSGPAEASSGTREANIHALRHIIGSTANVRELTGTLPRLFFDAANQRAAQEADQAQAASYRRSANSAWVKARSLFTPRCLAYYQEIGLVGTCALEAIHAFLRAGEVAKFNRLPKISYNPPADNIIQATFADWENLAATHRDLYLAIGHELAFGLRIAELAQAKWSWHCIRSNYPVLDGRASVKNGTGLIQVRALDPWYSLMASQIHLHRWQTAPDDYIIPGTASYRTDGLFRAVSEWLRRHGWETMKTNHALRAYAGSQVAMKYGIYEAQMFLRHSTVKVTEQNYSHFITRFKPANVDDLPARWAVIAPASQFIAAPAPAPVPRFEISARN